jgi:hypothetical protein
MNKSLDRRSFAKQTSLAVSGLMTSAHTICSDGHDAELITPMTGIWYIRQGPATSQR